MLGRAGSLAQRVPISGRIEEPRGLHEVVEWWIYTTFKNNGVFMMPSGIDSGVSGGDVFQFASGPVQSELTGPAFTPDGRTLFLAIQHPGEESESPDNPTSTWPEGDEPKSSLVAITGFA